jgi:hypothetical protein
MNAMLSKLFRSAKVALCEAGQSKTLCARMLAHRVLAALLMLALVLPGGLFSPQPAAAQARGTLGGFMELDSVFFGEGTRTFGPGQVITISGVVPFLPWCAGMAKAKKGRGEGTFDFFPVADIYVMADNGQPLNRYEALKDVSGKPNRITGFSSGAFTGELVAITQPAGSVGPGRYKIVMDQCLDGLFDPEEDIVLGDPPNLGFEVVGTGALPSIDYHQLKDRAQAYATDLGGTQIKIPLGKPIQVPGFCALYKKWVDTAGLAPVAFLTGMANVALQQCSDLVTHWQGIAADPPDPNFKQFAELGAIGYDFRAGAATPLERSAQTLANVLAENAAVSRAFLTSLERFQGAQAAGDDEYTILQAKALQKYIAMMFGAGGTMLRFYASLEIFDNALQKDPLGLLQEAQDLHAYLPQMRTAIGGLLLPVIGAIRRQFIGGVDTLVPIGLGAFLTVYIGEDPFLPTLGLPGIPQVRAFNGLPPIVFQHPHAVTTGPYSAPPGTALNFDSSKSTDPNGDALTYAWDLDGDGQFNDAATSVANFAFAQPGSRYVGVKVTDTAGNTNVLYAQVLVGDVNSQDIIASVLSREIYRITRSTGQVTTLRPGLGGNLGGLASLHVDLNGDIWVLSSDQIQQFDSNGNLLQTMTLAQVSTLAGVPLLSFSDFVLDGRGDILFGATENLGPGTVQIAIGNTVFGVLGSTGIAGRCKIFRLAKDASRASFLADVHQGYVSLSTVNGGLVETIDARDGNTGGPTLAIDPNGNLVVGGVNGLIAGTHANGAFTVDPDTGAVTRVIPPNRTNNGPVVTDPLYGTYAGTDLVFGGVSIRAGSMTGGQGDGGIEVDSQGNYIAGNGTNIIGLRLYRVPIPPQITLVGLLLDLEMFPIQLVVPGSPFLTFTDIAIDSAGDYIIGGTDFSGLLPAGIYRVTPSGGVFPITALSGPFGPIKVADVVPQIRKVTPKDLLPPPLIHLSNLLVSQVACPGNVDLNVSLSNTGGSDLLQPVTVYFFDGDPENGGTVVGFAQSAGPVTAGASVPLSATWQGPTAGTHNIFALAVGANTASVAFQICIPKTPPGGNFLTLAPSSANSTTGTPFQVTAMLQDLFGIPLSGVLLNFDVSGANTTSGVATTDASGIATFTYSGTAAGSDDIVASAFGLASNTASVTWQGASQDTTPPVLTLPANILVEATSAGGAVVNFTATALDAVDGPIAPSCAPASGATFPLGQMTVNCTATDLSKNSSSGSFTVTVQDTTPPTLSPHANMNVPATNSNGAAVNFTAPAASDIADASPIVACAPASGSTFPLGTTTVNCTATDAAGNIAPGSFTVTVAMGTPRIAGTLVGRGSDSLGNRYFDVQITNTGTGHARNLNITLLPLRTLSGSGIVTYLPALSGALPLAIGNLDVGASSTIRLFLNVPATVTRFSITESGTLQNVVGVTFSFSTAQSVIP